MKTCTKCSQQKPVRDFYPNDKSSDGRTYWCKDCMLTDARLRHHRKLGALDESRLAIPVMCAKCGQAKSGGDFSRSQLVRAKPACRACVRNQDRIRYHNDGSYRQRKVASSLKWRIGVTAEQFASMERAQDGKCAICHRVESKRRLAVDHDHETGRVRALLCTTCNTALGSMRDDPELLRTAARYLEQYQ